ncbi:MAG: TonB C-terminal domain-containing protein [Candidatus Sedimenticola sp. (ex Thyasira tokunagai)]
MSFLVLFMFGCSTLERPVYIRSYPKCIDVDTCFNIIRAVIESKWHIPESAAEKGLQAKLRVHLGDDKEVIKIVVVESSGDLEFDQTALDSIQLAKDFRELDGLSKEMFETNFRKFIMVFKPD